MDPLGQPGMVRDEEHRQMVSYHDMTAQSGSNVGTVLRLNQSDDLY